MSYSAWDELMNKIPVITNQETYHKALELFNATFGGHLLASNIVHFIEVYQLDTKFNIGLWDVHRDILKLKKYSPVKWDELVNKIPVITNQETYHKALAMFYEEFGQKMLETDFIFEFIATYQLDSKFNIDYWKVWEDLCQIENDIKMQYQNQNVSTTPPQQNTQFFNTANNSMRGQGKSILREQELFEIIRNMPLMIMNESNPSSNMYISSFCINLVNLDIVSQATSDSAIQHYEQNVANKRQRTSDKAEYHKRMESNLLFLLFEYSYMLNIFEALKGRTADTINIDYEKFFSLVSNDCRERAVQNLNQEVQRTPSIKNLLQSYYNNKTYQMPTIGTISNIENDYIVAFLMVGSLDQIMQYIFKADLQNTLQMINTYSGNEIKQTLDSYITQKCSMRLSMYAGDKWEWRK